MNGTGIVPLAIFYHKHHAFTIKYLKYPFKYFLFYVII